jgi:hypothetical protein
MRFDTKIAIAVRENIAARQQLNVTAFLASGLAAGVPGIIGEAYGDASGNRYLALFRQPVLVYAGTAQQPTQAHRSALDRRLAMAVYTEDMFATGNDDDNRAVVLAVPADALNLVGLALSGSRGDVDRTTKGMRLHP